MKRLTYLIPISAIAVLMFVSVALAQSTPVQGTSTPQDSSTNQSTPAEQSTPQSTVQTTESLNIEPWGYYPAHMQIPPGTTISWFNIDSKPHTVTADDGSFDSGEMRSNDTFTHTFDTPGKWDYHSTLDPSMTGSITVVSESTDTPTQSGGSSSQPTGGSTQPVNDSTQPIDGSTQPSSGTTQTSNG